MATVILVSAPANLARIGKARDDSASLNVRRTTRWALLGCLWAVLACERGGNAAPIEEIHSGALDAQDSVLSTADGSYYDDFELQTTTGYQIVVTLESAEFDPYVHLFDGHRNQLAYNDDEAPGRNSSRISFTAPYTGKYYVMVNSREPGETGRYLLTIQTKPP
jgi:hypothetical protein